MGTKSVVEQLQKLRDYRRPRVRPLAVGAVIDRIQCDSERSRRKLGQVIDVWQAVAPAEIVAQTRIDALNRGVLHVVVPNASVRYELDRLLREGLEDNLRAKFRGTLRQVRVKVGEMACCEN